MLEFNYLDDFDFFLAVFTVAVAFCLPRRYLPVEKPHPASTPEPWFFRRAYRPILVVFAASLLLNVFLARSTGIPAPQIHDEFAYLLTSDTFASGRLTNETHPMWRHLESFYVFHTPSYQAKYPPGQGAALAVGQVLTGEPIFGVWLSLALACAAVCWALLAVFPAVWAMVGGLLAACCPQMVRMWGQSYWGGAVAMLGGALVFGALFRFGQRVRIADAVTLGAGLFVLAISRPFEGCVISVPCAAIALWFTVGWIRKDGWRPVTMRFLAPVGVTLLLGGAALLYYNHRLVGDAWKLPYSHYHGLYKGFQGSPDQSIVFKVTRFWMFFVGPVLTVALFSVRTILRRRESCVALGLCGLLFGVSVLTSKAWPHYVAPAVCLIYVVLLQGLIGLGGLRAGERPVGAMLARAIPIAYALSSLIMLGAIAQRGPTPLWADDRRAIEEILEDRPGRDLVLVRYSDRHSVHEEWVYNRADIDEAAVVWARERSGPENRALVEYFGDRKVWLLFADGTPRLVPVRVEASDASSSQPLPTGGE